jgi:uncharacterized short protein YbdD (DUF466 family)
MMIGRGRAWLTALKRVVGMPNYEAYLAHLRAQHPECPVPTEAEYYELYLQGKYNGVGNRCC